jgi:hypothetical protein
MTRALKREFERVGSGGQKSKIGFLELEEKMGAFATKLATWFQGKKTILGGVLIMVAAVAGVWYGKVDAVTGLTIFGAGLSVVGGSAKANRHQVELLTALQGVAQTGADYRAGNAAKALADGEAAGHALAPSLIGSAVAAGGASLHITGSTAADVSAIATAFVNGGPSTVVPVPAAATTTVHVPPVTYNS